MNYKKVLISGLAAGFVILAVEFFLGYALSADYTTTPQIWKPMTEMWYYQIFALYFIEGIIYAAAFSVLQNSIPGKGWKKGQNFGLLVWIVATVPGMLMTYFTMAVPDAIVLSWLLGGLISIVFAGIVISLVQNRLH